MLQVGNQCNFFFEKCEAKPNLMEWFFICFFFLFLKEASAILLKTDISVKKIARKIKEIQRGNKGKQHWEKMG